MVVASVAVVGGAGVLALSGSNRAREDQEARQLLRRLADSDPEVRTDAGQGLKKLGPYALPALREACGAADVALARRARRLLDEMEGRVAVKAEPAPAPAPVVVEPARPPVEITLSIPRSQVRSGEPIRFYVRLRNNTEQPLLVARHKLRILPLYRDFAQFEIGVEGGEAFTADTELWPRIAPDGGPTLDIAAVPAGATVDLYEGESEIPTPLHTRLMRPGRYELRFVYDASGPYTEAIAKATTFGAAMPSGRIASNAVVVTVQ